MELLIPNSGHITHYSAYFVAVFSTKHCIVHENNTYCQKSSYQWAYSNTSQKPY